MKTESDAGFGIVEIIVSMLMLAILAIVLAPVIIGGVRSTAKMSTIATATQLVNEGLEGQRASLIACPAPGPGPTSGSRDARQIALTRTINYTGNCGTTKLAIVEVRVSTAGKTTLFPAGTVLATATTTVYIP